MEMKINKRLREISAFIENNSQVIDIGCDHGLLGIYLCLNKKNIHVISSDINEKPLSKAYENTKKYHLLEKIEILKGNGLECVSKNTDTVVISGMGGVTICDILKNIEDYPNIKKIIVSPNNDFIYTRKKITKHCYQLNREKIVLENGKYYLISEYIIGKKKINYFFGKLESNNETISYYNYLYQTNLDIINKLPRKRILKKIKLKIDNYHINRKFSFKKNDKER